MNLVGKAIGFGLEEEKKIELIQSFLTSDITLVTFMYNFDHIHVQEGLKANLQSYLLQSIKTNKSRKVEERKITTFSFPLLSANLPLLPSVGQHSQASSPLRWFRPLTATRGLTSAYLSQNFMTTESTLWRLKSSGYLPSVLLRFQLWLTDRKYRLRYQQI